MRARQQQDEAAGAREDATPFSSLLLAGNYVTRDHLLIELGMGYDHGASPLGQSRGRASPDPPRLVSPSRLAEKVDAALRASSDVDIDGEAMLKLAATFEENSKAKSRYPTALELLDSWKEDAGDEPLDGGGEQGR